MSARRFDVFVSYTHADTRWVRKTLIPRLEKAGLDICIDRENFDAGDGVLQAITKGIRSSRHTLLVITRSYLNSVWTRYE